jgi:hypothetical protein
MKILTLMVDDSPQNPLEDFDDGFKLYSFSNRLKSYRAPSDFFDDNGRPRMWLRNKLRAGTAFLLSYYEHGGCVWSLRGEGPQCQWDSVDVAGVLVWERKPGDLQPTYAKRRESAKTTLETYTSWCNGEVYGYSVDEVVTLPCGHTEEKDVDSCFGFYGNDLDYMAEQVRAAIDGDPDVEIKGDAKDLASYKDFVSAPVKKETEMRS